MRRDLRTALPAPLRHLARSHPRAVGGGKLGSLRLLLLRLQPPPRGGSDASDISLIVAPASSPRSPDALPAVTILDVQPTASVLASPTAGTPVATRASRATFSLTLQGAAPLLPSSPPLAMVPEDPTPPAAAPSPSPLPAVTGVPPAPDPASPAPASSPRRLDCSQPLLLLAGTADPDGEGETRVTTPVASQPPPPRSAAYSRRGRSSSTPVTASRQSLRLEAARTDGSPALPIPERAELRAAARNLEPGHLAKVASDSAIVFRGESAPPLVQIAAIQAREILDGKLAEARQTLLAPSIPSGPPPNIRGFGHDGRRRQLIEYVRDEHIDIVAIQETMRSDFSLPELDRLSTHLFVWHWLPSSGNAGHSGGILLGVKDATFEVGSMDRGQFFVSMELYERALNFKWEVIIVCGPADDSRSTSFLEELNRKVSAASLPVVVGGDFNLLRFAEDKSNDHVNYACMQMFNDCIADLGLHEIDRIGARFTWTNRQASPTQSVLDRVLVSPKWDLRCPLASLRAITRIGSDHVPLLLSSSEERPPIPPRFRFETFRLSQTGFVEAVGARWFMKGWGANLGRDLRERKKALLTAIQALDLRADTVGLSPDEWLSRSGLSLALDCWSGRQLVSAAENVALTAPFSEDEVWAAIRGMNPSSAPGPDGLPVKFFQTFWNVIKPEIMAIFDEFYVGTIDLGRLNYGIISLIPKVPGASDIRQFRPITVINVIFRILAKGYANRVTLLADLITHPNQSAFVKERYILDGVLVLHEVLHEVRSKHLKAVFLKIDFHKAYDTVSWSFLREVLLRKGFDDRWITRVMQMMVLRAHCHEHQWGDWSLLPHPLWG
nr:uncharacterized protein LOC109734646 [Aegilops tauschii subsp. strangulata]